MSSAAAGPIRWGFLGCGRCAHDFATAMGPLTTAKLQACAARSLSSAEKFASDLGFTRAFGSYEALCADPEVDVVYVATMHSTHAELAMLALNHGKHVLVEKPMAMNAKEASQVISLAKEKGLFFMEGMWTRFFPAIRHVRKLLADGAIGEVQHVQANYGLAMDADSPVWSKSVGGGGLLGIGIYPLAFVTMVFGTEPEKVTAVGKLSSNDGVDAYASVTFEYGDHKFATFQYSLWTQMPETATILGSKGSITVETPFHTPTTIALNRYESQEGAIKSLFPWPAVGDGKEFNYGGSEGFLYEAEGITNAILAKQSEAREYSLDETLGIHKLMDTIRQQLGVVYDADNH